MYVKAYETRVPNCHKIRPFDGWEYFDWQNKMKKKKFTQNFAKV